MGLNVYCTYEHVVYHFRYVFDKQITGEKMIAVKEIKPLIKHYIERLNKQYQTDQAREHSHRGSLEELIASLIPKNFTITNEPAHIACGAPDYVITDNNKVPVAFIEAKDIGDSDLDGRTVNAEQFNRYKVALNSVIFTDYLDFHLYQKGEFKDSVRIAELKGNKIVSTKNDEKFAALIDVFLTQNNQPITSTTALARYMAHKARFLAKTVEDCFEKDKDNEEQSVWYHLLESFRRALITDLTEEGFADMYAQTIAYGLFVARLNDQSPNNFSRLEACNLIPRTNPFLRSFFQHVGAFDLDQRVEWIVDDLANLFLRVDVEKLEMNYHNKKESDPFFHFYEEFLAEYDPELRKAKGVWYTPQPVVSFIVRSIDQLLISEFGLKRGLADSSKITVKEKTSLQDGRTKDGRKLEATEYHRVQILDPAVGSGTFLVEVLRQIYDKFKNQRGLWNSYVDEHLIQRINGFELLMAPYVIAHLKFSSFLIETGYTKSKHWQRVNIFLTNSLDPHQDEIRDLLMRELNIESKEANAVKENKPIMVMIGNPPYNGSSQNKNDYIDRLMLSYKQEPSKKAGIEKITLKEKQMKWLNDDYVKFIRIAQEYITKGVHSEGLIGFITPHGFIDNPTFRGMRYNLLKTFDKLYILNLHGNAKKKETAPDGSKDENVFDIQQGVAITFFVKTNKKNSQSLGEVYYADLYGLRAEKYEFLNSHSVGDIRYQKADPTLENMYRFDIQDETLRLEWEQMRPINTLFKINNVGLVSARDNLCIQNTSDEVIQVIQKFINLSEEDARETFQLGDDTQNWKVSTAQQDVKDHNNKDGSVNTEHIKKITYRPLDNRYTYYTSTNKGFLCRPCYGIMRHMCSGSNMAIITARQSCEAKGTPWSTAYVSDTISDFHVFRRASANIFPMYQIAEDGSKFENITSEFFGELEKSTRLKHHPLDDVGDVNITEFTTIDVMDYIYAILYAPSYRTKYKPLLDSEFPRIPLPNDGTQFKALVDLGCQLRELHLSKQEGSFDSDVTYPEIGDNVVSQYKHKDDRVYINKSQYFGNVPREAWEFFIGGYQPLEKWLKDRKGQVLSFDEITHYQYMVYAISKTIDLMSQIDQIVEF